MEDIIQTTISTTIEEIIKNSNLFYFNWTTLTISIIAIIISIWSVIWTVNKNNKSSYKNNVYEDILKNPLHKELPSFIQKVINVETRKINENEIDKFQEFLMGLRKEILFFKYMDNKFYNEIDSIIMQIDDNIVLMINKKENFDYRYEELIKQVKRLYKCVEKYLFK